MKERNNWMEKAKSWMEEIKASQRDSGALARASFGNIYKTNTVQTIGRPNALGKKNGARASAQNHGHCLANLPMALEL